MKLESKIKVIFILDLARAFENKWTHSSMEPLFG